VRPRALGRDRRVIVPYAGPGFLQEGLSLGEGDSKFVGTAADVPAEVSGALVEVCWRVGKSGGRRHRSLLVDHPAPCVRVQGMRTQEDDTEETPRDVGGVVARHGLTSVGEREGGFPQPRDEGVSEGRWILQRGRSELGQPPGGVHEDAGEGDFSGICEVRNAKWVADLGVELEPTPRGVVPTGEDAIEVAVDPVHRSPLDGQPGPTIHPGPPGAGSGHFGFLPGRLARQPAQGVHVQGRAVVQAEVHV
jgi:hypothetical protein